MFSALRVLVSKLPCGPTSSWKIKIKYWEKLWIYSNMWVYIYIFKYWKNMEEHKDTCSSRNISSLWCSHDAWQKPWSITHVPSASMPNFGLWDHPMPTSCFHDWFIRHTSHKPIQSLDETNTSQGDMVLSCTLCLFQWWWFLNSRQTNCIIV